MLKDVEASSSVPWLAFWLISSAARPARGDQRIGQASGVLAETGDTHCQINKLVLLSYQIAIGRLDGLIGQRR